MSIELPHTDGCLVCGKANPHGLHLHLSVDPDTGIVRVAFTPTRDHIGFAGIVHGGILATVLDEAMVWAATWPNRRFCVCGEMTVRFRRNATVGDPLTIVARVETNRPRLVTTTAEILGANGDTLASGSGKYVPMPPDQSRTMFQTMIREPATTRAYDWLVSGETA
jgi:acyl-coenzyme A thioesterase PaaI-like protein